ncbi:MAG: HDOD domain-containing protein [Desulfobacteraceae bacterium]|nr:HDOD domain-containing protein [Desulfobacteraceae bacterium]
MNYQKTEHIAAGRMKADKNSSSMYQAYLGTCLGVALYDKTHKIGGMIHILLPEPLGTIGTDCPEKYASTGIPILIDKILSMGSSPENLRAVIAGGALVGPVSPQDIGLDIGGRSTDITRAILQSRGIKIIKSETGGFFTCTLELNMETGKTTINPAWEDINKPREDFIPPTLDDINKTIENIKPIPQTALKILRMFQDNRYGITEITRVLSRDQVLSGQTLKLCNSAMFAGPIKVDTLKEAVLLLGEDQLLKSVITAAVDTYYHQTGISGYSLCRGGLFFHSVGVAITAENLAKKTGRVPGKHAYTAGLLHDIGKVILDQYISEYIPLLFRNLSIKTENFLDSEKKLLGISHARVGEILARKWQFSTSLSQVIRHHHHPENAREDKDLTYIVYLADLLMEKFHAGYDLEKMQVQSMEHVLEHLGLTPGDIPEIIDTIPTNIMNTNQ